MRTKEKILTKSIELFNEKGVSSTSPNQIAESLNISPGNLTYHFKTKSLLVKAVYDLMCEDSKDYIDVDGYLTLNHFREIMMKFEEFKKKYRFFFTDLTYITRNFPEAELQIQNANSERFKKARKLFDYYIESGRLVSEERGVNYTYLLHNIWTIAAFYDEQNKITPQRPLFGQELTMVDMTWYMILPYLTEDGKKEYDQINAFLARK